MKKAVFNWSGGKDSMLALHRIIEKKEFEVKCLLTSISSFQRISMHGVRKELLEKQAEALQLPLRIIQMPEMPDMNTYESVMNETWRSLKAEGITHSIFGDVFLEDLRRYREDNLKSVGAEAVFPLWGESTKKLIDEFTGLGYKTIVSCVSEKFLDKSFAGRIIDKDFINDLPSNVDPCGENGEFHTFVFDGPLFKNKVDFRVGETVYRKYESPTADKDTSPFASGFWFTDLIPTR